jgi:hypothetical protein
VVARIASIGVLALVAGLGGYALGHRAALRQTLPMLAADTQFNVAQRIESLAKLRLGDTAGAVADLEAVVDVGVVNTLQWRAWSDLEPPVQRSIQLAKAYHSKFPSSSNAVLDGLLKPVPVLEAQSCSPALRMLLEQPGGGASLGGSR